MTCMRNLKYYINELICETDAQTTEKRLLVAIMVGGCGKDGLRVGTSGSELLYREWINKKTLCTIQGILLSIL